MRLGGADAMSDGNGRSGLTHPRKAAMVAALARTGNVSASARAAEIERSTHYRWLSTDPEYAIAVEQALEDAVDVLEAVARKRAIVGSDPLLMFLLKAARPEKYRERHEVKHAGKIRPLDGDPFEILRDPVLTKALDDHLLRRAGKRPLPSSSS